MATSAALTANREARATNPHEGKLTAASAAQYRRRKSFAERRPQKEGRRAASCHGGKDRAPEGDGFETTAPGKKAGERQNALREEEKRPELAPGSPTGTATPGDPLRRSSERFSETFVQHPDRDGSGQSRVRGEHGAAM